MSASVAAGRRRQWPIGGDLPISLPGARMMRLSRLLPFSLALLAPAVARAQSAPSPAEAAPPEAGATQVSEPEAPLEGEASAPSRVFVDPARRTGFTTGLRLGFGLPLGKAG